MEKNKKIGRPAGKIKTSKIEVTIEPELKDKFMKEIHIQNKQVSVVLREWIIQYLESTKNKEE